MQAQQPQSLAEAWVGAPVRQRGLVHAPSLGSLVQGLGGGVPGRAALGKDAVTSSAKAARRRGPNQEASSGFEGEFGKT